MDVLAAKQAEVGTDASVPDWITGFQSPLSDRATAFTSSSSDSDFKASDDGGLDAALTAVPEPQPDPAARKDKASQPQKQAPASKKTPTSKAKTAAAGAKPAHKSVPAKPWTDGAASEPPQQPQTNKQPAAAAAEPEQAAKPADTAKLKATRVLADRDVCKGKPLLLLQRAIVRASPAEGSRFLSIRPCGESSCAVMTSAEVVYMLAGEVPLMLPEKLATGKYLMELEPAKDGADDLTGDAGAVGRMLVSGEQVQLASLPPGPGR